MEESASAACMVAESAVVKTNAKEVEYASKEVLEATLEMNKQSDVLGLENIVEKAVVKEAVVEEEEKGVAKDEKAVKEGLELEEQDEGMESEEEINKGLGSEGEEKAVKEKKVELEEEDGEGLKVENEKVELE